MSANTYLPISPVTPMFLLISAITQTYPMVITVTTQNNYVVGQLVHLSVPASYGMTQANQLTGQIVNLSNNNLTLTVNIDATQFDAFSIPLSTKEEPATVAPGGSRNLYNTKQVPFQSVGNFGN